MPPNAPTTHTSTHNVHDSHSLYTHAQCRVLMSASPSALWPQPWPPPGVKKLTRLRRHDGVRRGVKPVRALGVRVSGVSSAPLPLGSCADDEEAWSCWLSQSRCCTTAGRLSDAREGAGALGVERESKRLGVGAASLGADCSMRRRGAVAVDATPEATAPTPDATTPTPSPTPIATAPTPSVTPIATAPTPDATAPTPSLTPIATAPTPSVTPVVTPSSTRRLIERRGEAVGGRGASGGLGSSGPRSVPPCVATSGLALGRRGPVAAERGARLGGPDGVTCAVGRGGGGAGEGSAGARAGSPSSGGRGDGTP